MITLALIIVIPNIYAQTESTQIDATIIGNSAISVNGEVGERLVRAYAQFINFDISEKYFNVDVIQLETGNIISSSQVKVYSTFTGLINFGSLVGYLVNDRDVCSYDMSDEDSKCTDVMTGNYQIQLSTRDGVIAKPVQFSIHD